MGRKKRRRMKKSYSLNNSNQKNFFWSIVWGGKRRFPGYGSRNKPKERVASAMQFLLFIRIVFASWIADLTENEHFRTSRTDLQARAMCWTALRKQAALLKTCTWVMVEAVRADIKTAKRKHISCCWRGGRKPSNNKIKKPENHLPLLDH